MGLRTLVLTDHAREDLRGIRRFTVKQYGRKQYDIYRTHLEQGFRNLRHYPDLGFDVSNLATGYRCLTIQSHRIFYRYDAAAVFIVAILHENQLPRRHLGQRLKDD